MSLKPTTTYSQILSAEQELQDAQHSYLHRWGWDHTCATPGSYWLWRRDFADSDLRRNQFHDKHPRTSRPSPYGIVTATTEIAIAMTVRELDEQPELNEEEEQS